jgi:membrane fusion protein
MTKLFRDEAVQRKLLDIGVPLDITSSWMKILAAVLCVLVLAGIVLTVFGSYSHKARVMGFLIPDKGLIKVIAPHEGRISERHAKEGQHVNKDDALFIVDVGSVTAAGRTADLVVDSLRQRRTLLEQEIARLKTIQSAESERLDVGITSLKNQIISYESQLKVQDEYLQLTRNSLNRNKALEAKQIYSKAQREKSEMDVANVNIQMSSLQNNLASAKGELAQSVAQQHGLADKQANEGAELQRGLAEVGQQLAQVEDQRFLIIRAPESGMITRITAGVGAAADMSTPLLTIVPDDSALDANLYVPSSAAGFVKEGAQVLLRYESFPYQKFGAQTATVTSITKTSVDPRELPFAIKAEEPLYLVTARISKDTITAFGKEEPLVAGSKFEADLVLEHRKIWEWALEPLIASKASL